MTKKQSNSEQDIDNYQKKDDEHSSYAEIVPPKLNLKKLKEHVEKIKESTENKK